MKFEKNTRRKPIEYEKALVEYWKKDNTFEKSIKNRPKNNAYVFYDGPPFITGVPHHGTLLTSIVKDVVPRYFTMKGKRVERTWGWDCHGLPAEVFTEQKLGIQDRRDIGTKVSLEKYISTCRANMVQTGSLWEDTIDRIGRWVDFKGAYKTMDKEYMESVWWAFKELYKKGKIYEGEKVLLYCTRDATPISKAEVAMDNSYQEVTDPAVFVKLKLKDDGRYLLTWTTTPWTLPANTAAAVNKNEDYADVEIDNEVFIIAKSRINATLTNEKHEVLPYRVIRTFKGSELVGKRYDPLFADRGKNAHRVWHAPYVSMEEGTGLVHLAPAYGEEDYELAKANKFPFVSVIDDNGFYEEGDWKGSQVWDVNKQIAKTMQAQGKIWKIDYIRHTYPHCHRCGTKLMYRAHPSWFMDIAGQRQAMLEQNGLINWFPEHIKNGRSAKTIESAPDWNISRDRFWATAMPVWKGLGKDGKEYIKVIGSYAELKELSGIELEDYHRPWVDDVTFTLDGVKYKRIEKVMDCWFESGSMPFAQFHYPFENTEKFEQNFPGDFIVEYVPQVRAWFYYMNAVNVGLFGKTAFKTALVHGTIAGNDGRKMSKSFGNYTDPNELMDKYSADALRFLFLTSPLLNGEDFVLQDKEVADVNRKLSMIWNMYDFFTLYADVDGWEWNGNLTDPSEKLTNVLDKWIISKIHRLMAEIDKHMQDYDLPNATKTILPFIDDASNWYVRRSRKRFWKSDNDQDKNDAYLTLHYMLTQLSITLAPFTPFLAEELYKKLTGGESVHLLDWPNYGHIDDLLIEAMDFTKRVVNEGLSLRAKEGVKVRQPLKRVSVQGAPDIFGTAELYTPIITEELNIRDVDWSSEGDFKVQLDFDITPELKREGLMREVVRQIQNARKEAGLEVDDRINLSLTTEDKTLDHAITEHVIIISEETLAKKMIKQSSDSDFSKEVSLDGAKLLISLSKA